MFQVFINALYEVMAALAILAVIGLLIDNCDASKGDIYIPPRDKA